MKINPTDWVLYKINTFGNKAYYDGRVDIKFEKASEIYYPYKYILDQLYNRYNYTELVDYKHGNNIQLLLVTDERGENIAEKVRTLIEAPNSPFNGIRAIIDRIPHLHNKHALLRLYGAQNHINYGCGTKKSLAYDFLLNMFKSKETMKSEQKQKFLVELSSYDKETKKLSGRDYILIYNVPEDVKLDDSAIHHFIKNNYITYVEKYNVTQDILTIKSKHYKLTNGSCECNEERYKTLSESNSKDPIVSIDWEQDVETIKTIDKDNSTFDFFKVKKVDTKKIMGYLQTKYPHMEYKLVEGNDKPGPKEKESKKKVYDELYKERIKEKKSDIQRPWQKRLEDLPKPGTSGENQPRKVCCMEKKTGKIFRGLSTRVNKLVDTGGYIYCQKKFWKQIIYYYDIESEQVKFITPAKYNKDTKEYELPITTNITKSISGKKLGERKAKRDTRRERQNAFASYNQRGYRFKIKEQLVKGKTEHKKIKRPVYFNDGTWDYDTLEYNVKYSNKNLVHIDNFKSPEFTESDKLQQSTKDKKRYEDSLGKPKSNNHIRKNKNPKRNDVAKSWEFVLTIGKENDTIWKTVYVKAFHQKEAQDKVDKMIKTVTDRKGNITVRNYGQYDVICDKIYSKFTGKTKPWVNPNKK